MADEEIKLPPPEPFVPYATIFKMDPPGEGGRNTVSCLNCGATYLLKDVLDGELNDDQCPTCGKWALDYWRKFVTRKVPHGE